jgi:hypothetical protein
MRGWSGAVIDVSRSTKEAAGVSAAQPSWPSERSALALDGIAADPEF